MNPQPDSFPEEVYVPHVLPHADYLLRAFRAVVRLARWLWAAPTDEEMDRCGSY